MFAATLAYQQASRFVVTVRRISAGPQQIEIEVDIC
jgi:hypothetical protein